MQGSAQPLWHICGILVQQLLSLREELEILSIMGVSIPRAAVEYACLVAHLLGTNVFPVGAQDCAVAFLEALVHGTTRVLVRSGIDVPEHLQSRGAASA